MNKLTVVPQGGLCNRLRVMLSALSLSRRNDDLYVRVEWAKNAECLAEFGELFEPFSDSHFSITPRRWWHIPSMRSNLHLPTLWRRLSYDKQLTYFRPHEDRPIEEYLSQHRRVYVSTGYALCGYSPQTVQELRPRRELQERIDGIVGTFSEKMIGVHVRRTDNIQSQNTSTDEAFFAAMDRELEAEPYAMFFLATDDGALKSRMMARYPGHVLIQHTPHVRRDTLEGMEEAVVDLWCLSKTEKILGSYYSSFSETAAELGGIPLEVVGQKLVFASNNQHKLDEVRSILGNRIEILSLADIGCHDDIPETADTLEGNAEQKARYVYERYGMDCFADDTGLEVEALGGGPGVHTARYAYPDRHDPEANTQKLLAELKNKSTRKARFRTVIALIEKGKCRFFEGIVNGEIASEKRGTHGFGYDPVFIPEDTGLTFAELGVDVKNDISHRARAVRKLAEYING